MPIKVNSMVAVFCRSEIDYIRLNLTPKRMFKRIRDVDSIRGIMFLGVIHYADWYNSNKNVLNAYDELQIKQPELFTKN